MALMYPMAVMLEGPEGSPAQAAGEAAQRSVASGGCLKVLLGAAQAARPACADTNSCRGLHERCLLLLCRLLGPAAASSPVSAVSQGSATVRLQATWGWAWVAQVLTMRD